MVMAIGWPGQVGTEADPNFDHEEHEGHEIEIMIFFLIPS
jgi:hypothetical protein